MQYALSKGITSRKFDQEYVVFLDYSRETLVLHPIAFELLKLLGQDTLDFESILLALNNFQGEMSATELETFVQTTLQQFLAHGVVESTEV